MVRMMEPTISLICRNARLSLQKAALSRRAHMLSEELEHLRDFESLVSETLPVHPHFSAKRAQKELLELDSHLLNVRQRLAEIECKHPFLYKHHRKGGSSFNSNSKRPKESRESYKPQKKKMSSSLPHTTSRPPSSSSSASSSSSSSACKKGSVASFSSEYLRWSPPTPSKRSLSASVSRSPSLRSGSSGSLCMKNLKCSLELRFPLDGVVDDVVLPSEKLKLPSKSAAYRDTYDDDDELRFPSNKHLLSPNSVTNGPKYVGPVQSTGSLRFSNGLDAHSHQHQKGSSNGQQFTFCNPVFDSDSSRACSESISRSRLQPRDASEKKLKAILGECSYVASQLNSYGEAGLDKRSSAHTSSRVPSPMGELKVRSKGLPHEHVSGISDDEHETVLLVSGLTERMDSFQRMLNELNETVQSSSLRVQEQVDICEAKVKDMERQLSNAKLETNSELLGLKRLVKAQLSMKVRKGGSKRDCDGDGSFEERMQVDMDECSSKFDALQMRADSWMSKIHTELQSQVENAVASSMEKFSSSIRTDMETLELERLRDLGNLKKEMCLKLSLHESKEQLNKISEKQLDLIVEDVLGKQFSHLVEMFSAEKENEFAQIKSEVAYLRKEYEARFRGRGVQEEHAETMTHVKRQLHSIRNDGKQVKFLVDGMKKETEAHVHDIRLSINKLKVEALECRERILGLERLLRVKEQSDPKKL
ncbi:hypothetical protein GOP47_0026259 [Adiantum capillus-veneris]|nr:hypothetical protein GOP47_0026259 [Adiantum capillus-veneris]